MRGLFGRVCSGASDAFAICNPLGFYMLPPSIEPIGLTRPVARSLARLCIWLATDSWQRPAGTDSTERVLRGGSR